MNPVAVVRELARGNVQELGLPEPRDLAAFATDRAKVKSGFAKNLVHVPALLPQITHNGFRPDGKDGE
jgi:hypothetical protein